MGASIETDRSCISASRCPDLSRHRRRCKATRQLSVAKLIAVKEVEPAIFEIAIEIEGGAITILRMNVFTLQSLQGELQKIGR